MAVEVTVLSSEFRIVCTGPTQDNRITTIRIDLTNGAGAENIPQIANYIRNELVAFLGASAVVTAEKNETIRTSGL